MTDKPMIFVSEGEYLNEVAPIPDVALERFKNLTPAHLRCHIAECPSVHRLPDGRLLIVGAEPEMRTVETYDGHFEDRTFLGNVPVANDEAAILIHPDLLSTVIQEEVEKALGRKRLQQTRLVLSPEDWESFCEALDADPEQVSLSSEIEKAVKAERERCADIIKARRVDLRFSDQRDICDELIATIRSTPSQGEQ
jgi:hypothetical protein